MISLRKFMPYISLGIATLILFIISQTVKNPELKNVIINVYSNGIFFFIVYLFYDIIRQIIHNKEKRYLNIYVKNKIANDIFVSLYFLKKIIHGYNLDSNTIANIYGIINYSKEEIANSIKNQNYLGFQIFKDLTEVYGLFQGVLNDALILKYSTHLDSINILRISNNLIKLELELKKQSNYNNCAESGVEYLIINGKTMNPENDDKWLLVKRTSHHDRFVVYDSGYFEKEVIYKVLNRYVLKPEPAQIIAEIVFETFSLMKSWIPEISNLYQQENRFRIIGKFFSSSTDLNTKNKKIFTADIIETK